MYREITGFEIHFDSISQALDHICDFSAVIDIGVFLNDGYDLDRLIELNLLTVGKLDDFSAVKNF